MPRGVTMQVLAAGGNLVYADVTITSDEFEPLSVAESGLILRDSSGNPAVEFRFPGTPVYLGAHSRLRYTVGGEVPNGTYTLTAFASAPGEFIPESESVLIEFY